MNAPGTYVYCLVAAARKPSLGRAPKGLAGTGRLRLLEVSGGRGSKRLRQWLVVADAPRDAYGEAAINARLGDLDWISRAAVAHEAVVETFINAAALLPMKLFTIFTSDERALEHIARERPRIDAALNRVTDRAEWGVRVVIDRARAAESAAARRRRTSRSDGAEYLRIKKARRDAAAEVAARARGVVSELFDELSAQARDATRRPAADLPVQGGSLLLDAAFLVARGATSRFRSAVARRARALAPHGYAVSLTGPWPPYSFMRD
jgi:gas vesicle protein GvpL/GvpF